MKKERKRIRKLQKQIVTAVEEERQTANREVEQGFQRANATTSAAVWQRIKKLQRGASRLFRADAFEDMDAVQGEMVDFWREQWQRDDGQNGDDSLIDEDTHPEVVMTRRILADELTDQCVATDEYDERCRRLVLEEGGVFCGVHWPMTRATFVARPYRLWSATHHIGARAPGDEVDGDEVDSRPLRLCTVEEALASVKAQAKRKAPGPSRVPAELLQMAGKRGATELTRMFNEVLQGGEYRKEWRGGRLVLIYKGKGDRDDPSKYRPINLLETAYRTLETVIWRRVREQVDSLLSNLQFGFRPGRNTMHPLLTLQTIIDSRQKMGLPTFIAALDMQKAFDSADHRLLVTRLALKGADRPTCRLFGALMERHYSLIEQEGAAPARVAIERGVLQGGITSPGLFLVFADSLAEEIAEAPLTDPITVGGHTVPGVLFADDTTLCAANQEDLNIFLEVAGNWAAASGVKFNTSKSAILEISESARWGRRGRQPNLDMVRAPQRARQASSSDSPNNGRRHARQALDEQRDEEVVARDAARRAAVAAAAAAAEEAVATAALAAARDAAGGQDGNVEEEVEEQRRERAAAASASRPGWPRAS